MSDKISTGDFNYASVDEDTAGKLEYLAKAGKALIRKSQIQFIADIGKLLSEAREALSSHGDGTFVKWATAEFDIGKQTVFNYVNAWDKCLSNGWTNYQNWSATALYLASSDDIPRPVFKKLERLPSTGIIRSCDVKRVIKASKPKPEPVEEPTEEDVVSETSFSDGTTLEVVDADDSEDVPVVAPEPPATSEASIMLDSLGKKIPKHLRSASELAIQLQATGRDLDKYRKAAKDFAEQPGGEWISIQDIDNGVRTLKGNFQSAQFYCVCPRCNGKGCERCDNTGWLPEHRKNIL